jgi:hypothetical protein
LLLLSFFTSTSASSSAGFSEPLSASASSFYSSTRIVLTFFVFFFLGGLKRSKSGKVATILLSTSKLVSSQKISIKFPITSSLSASEMTRYPFTKKYFSNYSKRGLLG